jgi:hypothetical protein
MAFEIKPEFEKDFDVNGACFTVQVEYKGIVPTPSEASENENDTSHRWKTAILVHGHIIESGLYHWNTTERELTMEGIANHLASFWGNTPTVQRAQKLKPVDLDAVVENCAAFMFSYFETDASGRFDYDIRSKFMNDEGDWEVILHPNFSNRLSDVLVTFQHHAGEGKGITFSVYTCDRTFFTVL